MQLRAAVSAFTGLWQVCVRSTFIDLVEAASLNKLPALRLSYGLPSALRMAGEIQGWIWDTRGRGCYNMVISKPSYRMAVPGAYRMFEMGSR